MNFANDDEELYFLSIFAKTEELSAVDLAAKQMREKEERAAKNVLNATQQLTSEFRKDQKIKGAEKQRRAQREVTTQGYSSALHLHRNQEAVNRAARDLVGATMTADAGLPMMVVKGDKVETHLGPGIVVQVRSGGKSLIVAVSWGMVHLPTDSLVNHGVGAVPISLENAYQRAKAMYAGGQIKEALAVWSQGVRMLKSKKNPPNAALAAYLGAAAQAERALGHTRKALEHATEALACARMEGSASTKTLVARLEKTVAAIRIDLGELNDENTMYDFGLGIATEELLEMDPEALETIQDAITEAAKGDAMTLRQLLETAEMLGNREYNRGLALASTVGTKMTALMVVCGYGQVGAAKQLVQMGANLSFCDAQGFSCLVWACRANQVEMARVLLEDLNAPWIEPSKKASKEITQLLNAVPSAERRRRTTPSSRKKSATMVQRRSNNDSQKKSAGAAKTRPLEAWAPSKEEERFRVEGLGKKKKGSKKYDQFDANKKLGVKGKDYDESMYTTQKKKDMSKDQVRRAENLAKEIMAGKKKSVNGQSDAEDRHSAVVVVASTKNGGGGGRVNDSFTDAGVNKKNKKK
jgi:tetratricopeptide (TPR) repeat protein